MARMINPARTKARAARALQAATFTAAVMGSAAAAGEKDRPRTPPPPTPGPGEAVVYIYRTNATALAARGTTFFVDGVKAVTLGYHGCTAFTVPAGHHVLKQTWPLDISFGRSASIQADWTAGESYYYRFDVQETQIIPTAVFHWQTDDIGAEAGQAMVADCRYTAPLDLSKLKPPA